MERVTKMGVKKDIYIVAYYTWLQQNCDTKIRTDDLFLQVRHATNLSKDKRVPTITWLLINY